MSSPEFATEHVTIIGGATVEDTCRDCAGKEENFSTHQEEANSTSNEKKPSLSSSEMTRNERTVSKRRLIRQKYAQLSLIFLGALGLIHAFYFARAILIPIALAVVLFFLLAPVVRFMSRWRYVTESVAAGIVVLFMSSLIFTGSYFLATPVTSWIRSAPETFRAAEEKLSFLSEPVGMLDEASEEVSNITNGNEKEDVVKVAIQQPPIISYLLSSTVNVMAGTIITIVLVYLMLAMGHRSINSVVELMPSINDKKGVVNLLRNIELGISRYLVTITLINICLGVVIGFTLGLLGLPDPYLLGIMAALLNFIPYVGPAVGALIVFMISVVNMNTPAEIAAGPLIYLTINTIEGNLITPVIMGHSMKLNPAIVFLHIIFWGWVWGIGGVLLSVPILGILKITFNHFEETKPIAHLLSG